MSDAPLPNSPEARTPSGEIKPPSQITPKDQNQNPDSNSPDLSQAKPPTDVKPAADPNAPKPEAKPEGDKPTTEYTEADFAFPEGFTPNKERLAEATAEFKKLGLTKDQAQALINMDAKAQADGSNAAVEAYNSLRQDWQNQAKKQFGTKLETEVRPRVSRLIDGLGPELAVQFREAMNLTGVGDHPAFIAAIDKFAQSLGEGKLVAGTKPPASSQENPNKPEAKSIAQRMYPHLPSAGA